MKFNVIGIDFSSSPSKKKPIVIAEGILFCDFSNQQKKPLPTLHLERFLTIKTLNHFEEYLISNKSWIGGFDLPFSLSREIIEHFGWPTKWDDFVKFYCSKEKKFLRNCFKSWCDSKKKGKKFSYRLTDKISQSSPAMRWVNPPVAWMLYAGMQTMLRAKLFFPAHSFPIKSKNIYSKFILKNKKPRFKIALESYPAYTARKKTRNPYKSDNEKKNNNLKKNNRQLILNSLLKNEVGFQLALIIDEKFFQPIIDDGKGDFLDALICMAQAASAVIKPNFGLPKKVDPLEGWILTN